MYQILENLPEKQIAFLILVNYVSGKLNFPELMEVMDELEVSFHKSDFDELLKKNFIEKNNNHILLIPFVYQIVNLKKFMPSIKYAVASGLIKNLNTKLSQVYNSRYVDILVEYSLNNKQFYQLKSLLLKINQRLKD